MILVKGLSISVRASAVCVGISKVVWALLLAFEADRLKRCICGMDARMVLKVFIEVVRIKKILESCWCHIYTLSIYAMVLVP